MPKVFNTAAVCIPELHYMVDLESRLQETMQLVNAGKYFTINRARQYGKTTTLMALRRVLQKDYYVISMDFQTFGAADFQSEQAFSAAFVRSFLELLEYNDLNLTDPLQQAIDSLSQLSCEPLSLQLLFKGLRTLLGASDRPFVLLIDEVDSASNNQVFLDFLAQLRAQYINRYFQPAFQSVILAGVYDIRHLRQKIRPEDTHRYNSPWNIAADYEVDMSFSREDIAGMLQTYEEDYHTGMNIAEMAQMLRDYTSGYPFLVSRLCQLMDEVLSRKEAYASKSAAWTRQGFFEAVRYLLSEKITLFDSLNEKLNTFPDLNQMLQALLFTGKSIPYNYYEPSISIATVLGLVKNQNGVLTVANRIFDTWLYNLFLSSGDLQSRKISAMSLPDKNQFVTGVHLNMKLILERFVCHFHELYGEHPDAFLEKEGRKYFLLYLRPIINGTGNYYIEARTRDQRRTDLIIDYLGEQYIVEMKIWHGQEYNRRGEEQLLGYLNDYHISKGYMLSFNFNKQKTIGVHEITIGDKTIIEAVC